jgi:hypothetical protein
MNEEKEKKTEPIDYLIHFGMAINIIVISLLLYYYFFR